MLGAVIGAVGSIAGGLLGSKPTRQKNRSKSTTSGTTVSKTKTRAHLGQMVAAAERHGFNPLTVLRAGGLAAYSATKGTTTASSQSFTKGKGTATNPAPLGAGIAAAANSIGGAMDQGPSQASQAASDAWKGLREPSLVDQQLAHASSPVPVSRTFTQKTPQLTGTAGADGKSMTPTYEAPTVTNPFPHSWGWGVDPTVPDAEAWETRYSDPGGWYGAAIAADADIQVNIPEYKRFREFPSEVRNDESLKAITRMPKDAKIEEINPVALNPGLRALAVYGTLGMPFVSMFERPVQTHNPKPVLGNQGGW